MDTLHTALRGKPLAVARYRQACFQLAADDDAAPTEGIARGSRDYWRINFALFLAGFSTFSLIYCVQPLLPLFAQVFTQTPAQSSLLLSLTTGCLAFSMLGAGIAADRWGSKPLMFVSMCGAAVLHLFASFSEHWQLLLALRALEGIAIAGVPAVAMAYLAEEIEPKGLGFAMGLYVGSTAFGGMSGRLAAGLLIERFAWHEVMGIVGVVGIIVAIGFMLLLPPSRHKRVAHKRHYHKLAWKLHLGHPHLRLLFLTGFLVMGAFVTGYNYLGFRLLQAPYLLTQSQLGWVFTVYLCGILASPIAGAITERFGRARVLLGSLLVFILGLAISMRAELVSVILGICVMTIGFFAAHGVASGWVGRMARPAKGHATSLYLLAYYLGSSVMGSVGGWFWHEWNWPGVAAFIAALLGTALMVAINLQVTDADAM